MSKIVRKGKNPGAVDTWLDSLGLYRKNVAYDETCLFRAVSEQLFDCQIHHERVRKECITYARERWQNFMDLMDSDEKWFDHLDRLEKHMVVCGDIELQIISKKYEREIVLFDAAQQTVHDVTNGGFSKTLLLCLLDEDHFDVVYKREHINTAGFCQAIVYKILYENVFDISNVDDIVNVMLYDKNSIVMQAEPSSCQKVDELNNNDAGSVTTGEKDVDEKPPAINNNIAPFPFKVAKALDPSLYRNIEYDSWGEVRREMRLGEWYYGDDKLILGTKCIYNERGVQHDCYIQEIIKNENKCVIYLMKLAQKRTVNYADLSPENDAKPWPLPYRFSKNLNISVPVLPPDFKFVQKPKKRNKDKKRTKSESSVLSGAVVGTSSEHLDNVNAFVGVPLQMQNLSETTTTNQSTEVMTDTHADPSVSKEQTAQPETPSTPGKYSFDPSYWYSYLPPTPDSFVWSQTATSPNVFNFKPMIASAPVTPDVVPYHDPNYPYYYNYHMDPAAYQNYSQWSSIGMDFQPPLSSAEKVEDIKCQTTYVNSAQSDSVQYSEANVQYQSEIPQTYEKNESGYETNTINRPKERPTLVTNLTPPSPSVEVYSPMFSVPPGTPMLYTPAPPPEMTEMIIPNTPILYTPTMDVQYVSTAPFIYPPTPPTAWYPAGVTSQGFIFPPTRN